MCKSDGYDLFSSSKKSKGYSDDATAFDKFEFIHRKTQQFTHSGCPKCSCGARKNHIHERIFCLCDQKREMALCMTTPAVIDNQVNVDAIMHEIQGIEAKIALHTEQINGLMAMPTKSNRSPNN